MRLGTTPRLIPAGWYKMSPWDPKGNLNPSRHSFVTLSRCVAASNGSIFHPKGPKNVPLELREDTIYTQRVPFFFVWPCQKKTWFVQRDFPTWHIFWGWMIIPVLRLPPMVWLADISTWTVHPPWDSKWAIPGWWFGTWILFFPSYWECHHPN